jgi:hypothetical protein
MKENAMSEQRDDRVVERYVVTNCCWPDGGRGGALFWGVALVLLGGMWLWANTVGLDDWGEWAIPALIVAWGAALLAGASGRLGGRVR